MQILKLLKPSTIALTCATLAACGGGGTPMAAAPTFGDVNSSASSSLTVNILDASAGTVTADTGSLDRSANIGSLGDLSEALTSDRSQITLTDGGAVTFDGDGFAVRFDADRPGTSTSGIAGIITATSELPTGTATYTGDTVLTATSGNDLFDLSGQAEITSNFGAGTPSVTTVLSNLSGSQIVNGGTSAPVAIADAGTLTLSGSAISGAGFSGGTAVLYSTVLSLTGNETVAVSGAFYGPDATEVGGVFAITGGETTFFGDFLAE